MYIASIKYVHYISMSLYPHVPAGWTMYPGGNEPTGGVRFEMKNHFETGPPKSVRSENHASCVQSPGNTLLKQNRTPASKLAFVISCNVLLLLILVL